MLNQREIDISYWSVLFDWMDIQIAQWRHRLFCSSTWYFEIYSFQLCSPFVLSLSLVINGGAARIQRFVVVLMWMDPTWVPVVVDFLRKTLSQVMNPVDVDFQSMNLPDVLMENVSNESFAWSEIQVCRTFISENSSKCLLDLCFVNHFPYKVGLKVI